MPVGQGGPTPPPAQSERRAADGAGPENKNSAQDTIWTLCPDHPTQPYSSVNSLKNLPRPVCSVQHRQKRTQAALSARSGLDRASTPATPPMRVSGQIRARQGLRKFCAARKPKRTSCRVCILTDETGRFITDRARSDVLLRAVAKDHRMGSASHQFAGAGRTRNPRRPKEGHLTCQKASWA